MYPDEELWNLSLSYHKLKPNWAIFITISPFVTVYKFHILPCTQENTVLFRHWLRHGHYNGRHLVAIGTLSSFQGQLGHSAVAGWAGRGWWVNLSRVK